jgi:MEDS: MEthanogen/methylotroph, DcmR Sensory domain
MQTVGATSRRTRPTGLDGVGDVPWGAHVCQFYRTARDLAEVLVPYFKAGLENNEQCVWVASEPLRVEEARAALREAVPGLGGYEERGQIRIVEFQSAYGGATEDVIRAWIDLEENALRAGYDGLRVTGNTFSVERCDWERFTDYERRIGIALQGRRILAICSYCLDRCVAGDLLDVLHNHECTLVRDDRHWRFIQRLPDPRDGEGLASVCGLPPSPQHGHDMQLYANEDFPFRSVAEFLAGSLATGGAAGAIATAAHLSAICATLNEGGVDVSSAMRSGRLLLLDAHRTLACLRVDREIEERQFAGLVAPRVREVSGRYKAARWFGEMVDLLSRAQREAEAVRLEGWWNRLREEVPFDLLCTYSYAGFSRPHSMARLEDVCGAHARVRALDRPATSRSS